MASLGTAKWADPAFVEANYAYRPGTLWLGRSASENDAPLGYTDDRHVCLVSGTRGGKGTSSIITNLCLWPGSLVVVDPKGENATVTAARRGRGAQYCEGIGQAVHVLDPFGAAQVPDEYRSRFNPLDALGPEDPESIDAAALLADAMVVVREDSSDPFWDMSARQMVKALILHVLTDDDFEKCRNLITVRNLIQRGDAAAAEALRSLGQTDVPPAHSLLWEAVSRNGAFGGRVAAMGDTFANMLDHSPKQYESVLQVANRNTEFLDSPKMEDCVSASDFSLRDLKTDPHGVSIYLSLPQRFMNTHNRWLRMMIGLILMEMEITPGHPACGHPVLLLLDEFAGLKRMESIETGVAQMAGFGVKMFFVVQSLEQLKAVYRDRWETFLDNCGLKLFFSIGDNFSRDYISKQMGETEIIREVRSSGASSSESDSRSASRSESESDSASESSSRSRSQSEGSSSSFGRSETEGTSHSSGRSVTHGENKSFGSTLGSSHGSGTTSNWSPQGWSLSRSSNSGSSSSTTTSQGTSDSWTRSETEGTSRSWGRSETHGSSVTRGSSDSETIGRTRGTTRGETHGETHGVTRGETSGAAETVHKRPLCAPDEIGKLFSRVDDRALRGLYPGLGLALMEGQAPVAFRRVNYFEDLQFIGYFGPHPNHKFVPPLTWVIEHDGLKKFQGRLSNAVSWDVAVDSNELVRAGDVVAWATDENLPVRAPCAGRIAGVPLIYDLSSMTMISSRPTTQNPFLLKYFTAKPGTLITVGDISIRYYADGAPALDPFADLEAHCRALEVARRKEAYDKALAERRREGQQMLAQDRSRERRRALLRESAKAWLKGAGLGAAVVAGDVAVSMATDVSTVGIFIGVAAGIVTAVCGYKVAGKYAEHQSLRPQRPGEWTADDYKKMFRIF